MAFLEFIWSVGDMWARRERFLEDSGVCDTKGLLLRRKGCELRRVVLLISLHDTVVEEVVIL
jgi:hypothetical protein